MITPMPSIVAEKVSREEEERELQPFIPNNKNNTATTGFGSHVVDDHVESPLTFIRRVSRQDLGYDEDDDDDDSSGSTNTTRVCRQRHRRKGPIRRDDLRKNMNGVGNFSTCNYDIDFLLRAKRFISVSPPSDSNGSSPLHSYKYLKYGIHSNNNNNNHLDFDLIGRSFSCHGQDDGYSVSSISDSDNNSDSSISEDDSNSYNDAHVDDYVAKTRRS